MQVIIRALNVLQAIARSKEGMTLQELVIELDIPLGSMHRLLAVLEEQRFVSRSPTNRRYFLGVEARGLTERSNARTPSLVTPHPELNALAEQSGETVFLTEIFDDRAVCTALVEGVHPLRLFVRIGQEMPLHAAAAARAILAFLDDQTTLRLLEARPLTPFTEDTPRTLSEVMERLTAIRVRGYDTCDDELDRGVWAISAPVRISTGSVCASVTLAAPARRSERAEQRQAFRTLVLQAAQRMSEDLGYVRPGAVPVRDELPHMPDVPPRKGPLRRVTQ
ncbi:IclR family transcriptional regulator [Nonomuraea sp. NPDC050691]|uniref:IclR family transcriptional regulator n=1 Tax=Nonomuraea sp. NPDC050691 TaxID=3155661 RepID=UPI0034027FF5